MMRPREAGVTAAGVTVAGVTEAGVTALPDHVRQRIAEADCIIAASRFHADLQTVKKFWIGQRHFQIFSIYWMIILINHLYC
jgi:hypothetical protein